MLVIRTLSRLITSYRADGDISCFRKTITAIIVVRGHRGRKAVAASIWSSSRDVIHGFRRLRERLRVYAVSIANVRLSRALTP